MAAERGLLYAAELSASQLYSLLRDESLAAATALLSRLTDVYFGAGLPADFRPDDWAQGRLFTPALEVRWWRSGDELRVELLCEGNLPEAVARYFGEGEGHDVRETELLLAGTYYPLADDPQGGFFAEAQVPQPLRHPYEGPALRKGDRVHLRGWLYMRDGIVCRTRFQEVVRHEQ